VKKYMNFKELILPITFALVATMALQYFFFGKKDTVHVETSFIAPQEKREYRPLNTAVDFFDHKRTAQSRFTDLETTWALLRFSTDGASLDSLDIKREIDGSAKTIRTIFPVTETERENRCFLVGLNEKTPFYYALQSFEEKGDAYHLVYRGENDVCVMSKSFIVDKNAPKINLVLEIAPRAGKSFSEMLRIFYPAPLMPDIREADVVSALVIDQLGVFSKKRVDQLPASAGWFEPELFGSDSRYFIHTMIKDTDSFAQRAYYKLENRDRLFSILESPEVHEPTAWHLSFYCGPKDLTLIAAVDERLEKALDYSGWLSHLAKLMLSILNWLFMYLHNYGLAIIVLTLLIQILLLPFMLRNNEEKLKKQQKAYQQKLAELEYRFKNDPDRLTVERAELIRKEGFPGLGCLVPFLLQIPIFFALNRVLSSSFELYQAPMLWIKDLSAKDPYYILPIIVTLAMLMPEGKVDPQQRLAKVVMAVVFGAVTASFSAGLTLYFACNRIFSLLQAKIIRYINLV
jgi:YidC/Oxa1 family membrane protein insertase